MITINVDQHWLDFNLAEITFIHIHTDNGRYKIFDSHAGHEYMVVDAIPYVHVYYWKYYPFRA